MPKLLFLLSPKIKLKFFLSRVGCLLTGCSQKKFNEDGNFPLTEENSISSICLLCFVFLFLFSCFPSFVCFLFLFISPFCYSLVFFLFFCRLTFFHFLVFFPLFVFSFFLFNFLPVFFPSFLFLVCFYFISLIFLFLLASNDVYNVNQILTVLLTFTKECCQRLSNATVNIVFIN